MDDQVIEAMINEIDQLAVLAMADLDDTKEACEIEGAQPCCEGCLCQTPLDTADEEAVQQESCSCPSHG